MLRMRYPYNTLTSSSKKSQTVLSLILLATKGILDCEEGAQFFFTSKTVTTGLRFSQCCWHVELIREYKEAIQKYVRKPETIHFRYFEITNHTFQHC